MIFPRKNNLISATSQSPSNTLCKKNSSDDKHCCICCGPNEERILDFVPREDGARNSG